MVMGVDIEKDTPVPGRLSHEEIDPFEVLFEYGSSADSCGVFVGASEMLRPLRLVSECSVRTTKQARSRTAKKLGCPPE